jgi:hypothetical protein
VDEALVAGTIREVIPWSLAMAARSQAATQPAAALLPTALRHLDFGA